MDGTQPPRDTADGTEGVPHGEADMAGQPRRQTYLVAALVTMTLALSGGAAVAAGPLTEKAVKKIAKTQVKKLAPKLSVAKAKNADALGGRPASAYVQKSGVRVDGTATSADIPLTGSTFTPILTKTLAAPTGGYLFVIGTLSTIKTGNPAGVSVVEYGLTLDGAALTTDSGYHTYNGNEAMPYGSGAISAVVQVSAGTHTIALTARDQGTGSQVRGRDLSLVFTPSGSAPVLPY